MGKHCRKLAAQKGYATILTLLLFAAAALAVFSMYDVGQTTSDKLRLQNTTDAAAVSTANILARDFNFIAYTNRAMVANQASIGQLVGLASWAAYLEREAKNLDYVGTAVSWIPYVGPLIKKITSYIKDAAEWLQDFINSIAEAVISAGDGYLMVLSEAQNAFHLITIATATDTLNKVVEANDPDVDLGIGTYVGYAASFYDAWGKHLVRNSKSLSGSPSEVDFNRARFGEFTDIVSDSRDPFATRRYNRWADWNLWVLRTRIDKHGGTDFQMVEDNSSNELAWDWTSMDTESLWLRTRGCGWSGWSWCSWKEVVPLGWGAAHALHKGESGNSFDYTQFNNETCWLGIFCFDTKDTDRWGRGAWENPISAWAASVEWEDNKVGSISGLRRYYDFAKNKDPKHNSSMKPGETSVAPGLLIYLSKPSDKIRRANDVVAAASGSRLDLEEHGAMANDRISALAKAEPYFARPTNLWPKASTASWHNLSKYNGKREHGNMYNPYWQVRLTEPTQTEWGAAVVFSGISLGGM